MKVLLQTDRRERVTVPPQKRFFLNKNGPGGLALFLSVLMLSITGAASAQPGDLDLTFDAGGGVNDNVLAIRELDEGKVLIVGEFTLVRDRGRGRIARLNPDGSVDLSFDPGVGANHRITAVEVLPNGKIMIGGNFTQFNNHPINRLARLHPDGSLDHDFDPGLGAGGQVMRILVEPDESMWIVGYFQRYDGIQMGRIARILADGALDPSFMPPGTGDSIGANEAIFDAVVQSDGKIVIGGQFSQYGGLAANRLIRLNPDGSRDMTFDTGAGPQASVFALHRLSNDQILVGGSFQSYDNQSRNRLARINADGDLDSGWIPAGDGANDIVYAIHPTSNDRFYLGGNFTEYGGAARTRLARIHANGNLDTDFDPGEGLDGSVRSIIDRADGGILVGGWFLKADAQPRFHAAAFGPTGTLDEEFQPGNGIRGFLNAVAMTPEGDRIVGGEFNFFRDVDARALMRVFDDGRGDPSFQTGINHPIGILHLAVQEDGMIVGSGGFTQLAGHPVGRIGRFHPDGSVDTTFQSNPGANGMIHGLAVQPDGKLIIGGAFTSYNGTPRVRLARLHPDGSLDTSFDPGAGPVGMFSSPVHSVAVDADGMIYIAGSFSSYGGVPRQNIARLQPSGALDTSFVASPDNTVSAILVQPDGKVVIGGGFLNVGTVARARIARLNSDGSLDLSFLPGIAANGLVSTLALQQDGGIIAGGDFTQFNGTWAHGMVRLNPNGSRDAGFADPGIGVGIFGSPVRGIALEDDGRILVAGTFQAAGFLVRPSLARFQNTIAQNSVAVGADEVHWMRGPTAPQFKWARFEISTDHGATWSPLGEGSPVETGWHLTGATLPESGLIRARGHTVGGMANGSHGIIQQIASFPVAQPLTFPDWIAQFSEVSEGLRGTDDSPAGDGIGNVIKYLVGMEPLQPIPPAEFEKNEDTFTLDFRVSKAAVGYLLQPQASFDLAAWDVPLSVEEIGETETHLLFRATLPVGGRDAAFLRLIALPAPD